MASVEFHENCGVAGVIAPKGEDAAPIAAKVGAELQHRGQEGGGIATKQLEGGFNIFRSGKRFGLAFSSTDVLDQQKLKGEIALAHTRYRTTGPASDELYSQPMLVTLRERTLVGGHNGNIANAEELLEELHSKDIYLKTENFFDQDSRTFPVSDSEVLFNRMLISEGGSWPEKIARALEGVEGAFSVTLATDHNELIALRDPWGIRPLSFGRINGYWIVASETSVLDKIGASDQIEVDKGEMWIFKDGKEPQPLIYDNTKPRKYCDFEDWYFSWPSSRRHNIEVELIREAAGVQLAKEERMYRKLINVDLVTCVPDTGRSSAIPFAEGLNLPYRDRIFKERYDDKGIRSFIGSSDLLRINILEDKYLLSRSLEGQIIYVVDDTAVRITTMKILANALKYQAGVKEVHLRFSAPKFIRPCVLGVNINKREELGAVEFKNGEWVEKSDEQIAKEINADSVAFLLMDGRESIRRHFGENVDHFCGYCHGGSGPAFDMSKYDKGLLLEQREFAESPLLL